MSDFIPAGPPSFQYNQNRQVKFNPADMPVPAGKSLGVRESFQYSYTQDKNSQSLKVQSSSEAP
jgi:hypothetical protein